MGTITNVISSALTGEAINFENNVSSNHRQTLKQTWTVTQDTTNMKWIVKTELYFKYTAGSPYNYNLSYYDLYLDIYDGVQWHTKYLYDGTSTYQSLPRVLFIMGTEDKIIFNGVQIATVTQALSNYIKLGEYTYELSCSPTGRKGIRVETGYKGSSSDTKHLWSDQTSSSQAQPIYLTLPSFSGMYLKMNGDYKKCMSWIKVNGTWIRVIQYKKVNGTWKIHKDTWQYTP